MGSDQYFQAMFQFVELFKPIELENEKATTQNTTMHAIDVGNDRHHNAVHSSRDVHNPRRLRAVYYAQYL